MVRQLTRLGGMALALIALGLGGRTGLGDGVMVSRVEVGRATDLVSSSKQEAVLIPDGENVTVILRTQFSRGPQEVAWLVPVPNVPTHIAQRTDDIFGKLEEATAPRFYTESYHGRFGFGCAMAEASEELIGGVRHEASGTAGMLRYDVLSAESARDLTTWLATNQYTVPAGIEKSLDPYIGRHFHFLAMRLRADVSDAPTQAPQAISYTYTAGAGGVPPVYGPMPEAVPEVGGSGAIVYPLIISRVSAAPLNEVVLYVLAPGRYECANWPNLELDQISIRRAEGTASGTTYEYQLQMLAEREGHTFVTEFAEDLNNVSQRQLLWELWGDPHGLGAPPTAGSYLVRMRALIEPGAMDRDVVLLPMGAAEVHDIRNYQRVGRTMEGGMSRGTNLLVGSLAVIVYRMLRKKPRDRWARALTTAILMIAAVLLTLL